MNPIDAKPYALLANDFHVGKHNIAEFEKNWDEMLAVCREYKINKIFIGGDLYESRAGQTLDVLMAVRRAFDRLQQSELNIQAYIADGNHDKTNGDSTFSYNNIFANCVPNIRFVSEHYSHDIENSDVTLHIISYFNEKGRFNEVYQNLVNSLKGKSRYNILYCHQGISGGLSKFADNELDPAIFKPFDMVLAGHYHDRKQIDSETPVEYIGASRQHAFGEDTRKGYTILYTDGSYDFVENEVNRRYETVHATYATLKDVVSQIASRSEERRESTSIRLFIECTPEEAKKIEREAIIEAGVAKIEVSSHLTIKESAQADFKTKFDKAGIKSEYEDYCKSQNVEKTEIDFGLGYLDKIDEDLCGI